MATKKEEKPTTLLEKISEEYHPKVMVNPVLVTVGKPALSHQTPVYAW